MKYKHGGNIYKVAREKGIDINSIIDFSANINPFGLNENGKREIINEISGILNYPDPDYYELKLAISKYNNILPEDIFLGNGAIDCLFFLINYLKSKSATIIAPSFVEYERSLKTTETKINYFFLREEEEFTIYVDELIKFARDSNSDLIIICNPNNPTAGLLEEKNIDKLLEFCKNKGVRLIVDEAFMDFTNILEENSVMGKIEEYFNLFVLRSLTKFFAIPGLRLGYIITKNKKFKDFYICKKEPWAINYFADRYAVSALKDKEYIENTKNYIITERKRLLRALNMIKGIKAFESHSNYIFLKIANSENVKKKLEDKNILIRSCENYIGLNKKFFRIAVKTRMNNMLILKELKEICEESYD